jgi:predicted lysophospholipase L1 biosynthesis ABC-type transport system permease subunit
MELPWKNDVVSLIAAIVGAVLLSVMAGAGASVGALRRRPAEVLRSD